MKEFMNSLHIEKELTIMVLYDFFYNTVELKFS